MRRTLLKPAILASCGPGLPAFAADESGATYGAGRNRFSLATGSPGELGLLKLLQEKKADMVMVHAPAQVDKAVKDGWATGKTLIGSNEFYIVGPKSDPAGIARASRAARADFRPAAK